MEGLRIGRDPGCDLLLNHPTVSRLHAGIREIEGRFYLFNLSPSNSTTLNGNLVGLEQAEALANGDQIRIGPFFLHVNRRDDGLEIAVTLQIGLRIGQAEDRKSARPVVRQAPASSEIAHALDLFWGKRSREKAARQSRLHPQQPPRLGKARFNWTPTRDLVRPWPFSVFIWSTIAIGALSIAAAYWYTSAYSPAPISDSHTRASFLLTPAIAKRPNAGSCLSCHSVTSRMETSCSSCHESQVFVATVTKAHADAGIGCLDCHTEHKGKDFRPMHLALNSCMTCHSDSNTKTYNGKGVGTPHGGTLGYPVVAGQWKWKGLDADELALRPKIAALRLPTDSESQWRSKQFHAMHLYRVLATGGVKGVAAAGASAPVLSCSSCHRSFNPIDRELPRRTCDQCHTGLTDVSGPVSIAAGVPNCVSCHVQHPKDKRHWNPDLLVDQVEQSAGEK